MPQIQKKQIEPDIVLLHIYGRITLGRECQDVELAVDGLIRDEARKVVFDLSELNYIDSTGVGILVMCYTKMRKAGGELRLASLQPHIADLMKMTRLDSIMPAYPTVDAAVENFGNPQ